MNDQDWQNAYDNDPFFKKKIDEAMASPTKRPKRNVMSILINIWSVIVLIYVAVATSTVWIQIVCGALIGISLLLLWFNFKDWISSR